MTNGTLRDPGAAKATWRWGAPATWPCLPLDPAARAVVVSPHPDFETLAVPDTAVADHQMEVADALTPLIGTDHWLIAPWEWDGGHRDDDVTGRAAAAGGARLLRYPLWVWHWARPGHPALRCGDPWASTCRMLRAGRMTARSCATRHRPRRSTPVMRPSCLRRCSTGTAEPGRSC